MKVNIGKYKQDHTKKRTIKVQIEEWDTWSLDHTLALIIHPALVKYKEDSLGTGHPCGLAPSKNKTNPCKNCKCEKVWHENLDKMIWSFKQLIDDEITSVKVKDYKAYQEKIQEGLDLFSKYFRSLWT